MIRFSPSIPAAGAGIRGLRGRSRMRRLRHARCDVDSRASDAGYRAAERPATILDAISLLSAFQEWLCRRDTSPADSPPRALRILRQCTAARATPTMQEPAAAAEITRQSACP